MPAKREKVHFESVEELLGAPENTDGISEIRLDQIYPFENHPFKVIDDDRMQDLVRSIQENGVLVPVIVRPDDEGTYEMVSGHRRMHAARLAGLKTIPAVIRPMTDDEAIIAMVDANVQREEILPSERAFALKMKMDAMRRQGFRADMMTSRPEVEKSRDTWTSEEVGRASGMGGRQVQRYIRLTELDSRLLDLVDQKRLPISIAVEISYLERNIQSWIYDYLKENGFVRKEQVAAIRAQKHPEKLTQDTVISLMNSSLPMPKDTGRVTFSGSKLNRYFPAEFSSAQREEIILQLLKDWSRTHNPG